MCQLCDAVQAEHQRQLTLVFSQHTAQVAELQRSTQLEEALKWRQHLAALEGQFQASKERGDRLEEEVRAARKLVPWTPAAHEVQHSLQFQLNLPNVQFHEIIFQLPLQSALTQSQASNTFI